MLEYLEMRPQHEQDKLDSLRRAYDAHLKARLDEQESKYEVSHVPRWKMYLWVSVGVASGAIVGAVVAPIAMR